MASQVPQDTPFGLEPNVAAGLAYLFGIVGGIVMMLGGGTNRFVKWAAAQSITMWGIYIGIWIVIDLITSLIHILALLALVLVPVIGLIWFVLWLWTFIMAFQGKEVEVPIIAGVTRNIFKNIDTVGAGPSGPPSV
jgi:uncharacterized membrane protein